MSGDPVKILYIDDNSNDQQLMRIFLEINNPVPAILTCVDCIENARAHLRAHYYDFFVLDNTMPEVKNFHETLELLDAPAIQGKIIVVSSNISGEEFEELDGLLRIPDAIVAKQSLKHVIKNGLFEKDKKLTSTEPDSGMYNRKEESLSEKNESISRRHQAIQIRISEQEDRLNKIQAEATAALSNAMKLVKIK